MCVDCVCRKCPVHRIKQGEQRTAHAADLGSLPCSFFRPLLAVSVSRLALGFAMALCCGLCGTSVLLPRFMNAAPSLGCWLWQSLGQSRLCCIDPSAQTRSSTPCARPLVGACCAACAPHASGLVVGADCVSLCACVHVSCNSMLFRECCAWLSTALVCADIHTPVHARPCACNPNPTVLCAQPGLTAHGGVLRARLCCVKSSMCAWRICVGQGGVSVH